MHLAHQFVTKLAQRRDAGEIAPVERLGDRVVGNIHAQQFFFPGQAFFVVLRLGANDRQRDGLHRHTAAGAATAKQVEHADLAGFAGALRFHARRKCRIKDHELLVACAGHGVHCAALDQAFQHAFVQRRAVDPVAEIFQALEHATVLARANHGVHRAATNIANGRKAKAYTQAIREVGELAIGQVLDRKAFAAAVDIGRQHRHTQAAALGHALRHFADLARRSRQHRRHILGRVVGFEPGSLVGKQTIQRCVRAVERVASEGQDQFPQLRGDLLADTLLATAFLEADFVLAHQLFVLLADGLDHDICFAKGVARDRLEQLHNLLLVHNHAIGIFQDGFENWVQILNRVRVVLVLNVDRNLLKRAGAVQRDHGVQVVHTSRAKLHQVAGHARAFKLEDVGGFAAPQAFKSRAVFQRNVGQFELLAGGLLNVFQCLGHD